MATVFLIGAGIHQRRAVQRAHELGLTVVAVDGVEGAAALELADHAYVHDFNDIAGLAEIGRRHGVQGVFTVSADRAVPVVAAVAEELGLPGIGRDTAFHVKNKVAMRGRLAAHGVPQPPFAGVRTVAEAVAAASGPVGFPCVVKPSDSGGQRGVFYCETVADVERHAAEAIAESPIGEGIVEGFMPGMELNGIVVVRGGEAVTLTLSDRRRPPGAGFAVGWMHVYPPSLPPEQVAEAERVARTAATAIGLRDAIAFPQLIARPDGSVQVVEIAARIPGGQMAALVRHAVGVDLLEVVLRQCLGETIPDELALPRFRQPLCIRFLTAEPGPLKAGRVTRIGSDDAVKAAPGVVQTELYFGVGEVIRPVQVDNDRRGYVIAIGDTNVQALERGEAAAKLFDIEVEPVGAGGAA
jgi:cysteine synthase A